MHVHILFVIDQCDLKKRWRWQVDQYKVEMAKGAPGRARKKQIVCKIFPDKKE